MMVLVDTTVWIDFFSGREVPHVVKLQELIENDEDICLCGVILTEILQGLCSDTEYQQTYHYLQALICFPMHRETFIHAAELYRSLRRKGITIRKPIDCMIAAVAIEHDLKLLHHDRDFDNIARHSRLKALNLAE